MRRRKRVWRIFLIVLIVVLLLPLGVYVGVGPSLSCILPSRGPVTSGRSTRVLISSGVERCYLLYAPPGFSPEEKLPVVVAFHGFAANAQGFRSMTGWEDVAEREAFLVVFPHGSSFPLRWNVTPGARIEHIDDVQFMSDLLADLSGIATIDPDRVYVSGFSMGGTLADTIACELADQVAAVGVVSGKREDDPDSCNPTRPVPVIAFFGTADPIGDIEYPLWFFKLMNIDPDKEYREYLPVSVWLDGWVARNGCDPGPEAIAPQGDASGVRYDGCVADAEVVVFHIEGGGHTWPGGSNLPIFGKTTEALNASEVMWAFFEKHPMPGEP
jgi:polyhydroxybutyrate depolymerase